MVSLSKVAVLRELEQVVRAITNAEFNSKPHELGVLSMARAGHPDSAGSQFFLCLGRVAHLDNQYTVFGTAADDSSREVIASIGKVETGRGDKPLEEVKIIKANVIES